MQSEMLSLPEGTPTTFLRARELTQSTALTTADVLTGRKAAARAATT